jgi:GTPase SAR1 family protein
MPDEIKHYATGSIIPLGDGFTGKSVLSRLIVNPKISDEELNNILLKTRKSYNIEIEFSSKEIITDDQPIITTLQLYVFPGQRQKISDRSTTFDEILNIFDCFPVLMKVSVLLLVYDVTKEHTLQSLEMWLRFALVKDWIYKDTLIVLVSNKTDLEPANEDTINHVKDTIYSYIKDHELPVEKDQIKSIKTSCVKMEGIEELRRMSLEWIAERGIKGVGIRDIEKLGETEEERQSFAPPY